MKAFQCLALMLAAAFSIAVPSFGGEVRDQYPSGSTVTYHPGHTYHLEFFAVCNGREVARIAEGKLPSEYALPLYRAVVKGTVKLVGGAILFNLRLRDVDPSVGATLPMLDGNDNVVGYVEPDMVKNGEVDYLNVKLTGPLGLVTPIRLWAGSNPGFEVYFPREKLFYNPAGGSTIQSKNGAVRARLDSVPPVPATLIPVIVDCS